MSPRSPRKRGYVRKVEGAKAPKALTLSDEEFQHLCKNVATYLQAANAASEAWRETTTEARVGGKHASALVGTPPPNPPYKPRLENIFVGLVELRQHQRGFLGYLNPTPEPGTATGIPSAPCGLDELISAIESELNLNQTLFRDLQNKF